MQPKFRTTRLLATLAVIGLTAAYTLATPSQAFAKSNDSPKTGQNNHDGNDHNNDGHTDNGKSGNSNSNTNQSNNNDPVSNDHNDDGHNDNGNINTTWPDPQDVINHPDDSGDNGTTSGSATTGGMNSSFVTGTGGNTTNGTGTGGGDGNTGGAVPEPATAVLGVLGLGAIVVAMSRRK